MTVRMPYISMQTWIKNLRHLLSNLINATEEIKGFVFETKGSQRTQQVLSKSVYDATMTDVLLPFS